MSNYEASSGESHIDLLIDKYSRAYHAFCQRLARGKPVSKKFVSGKLNSLGNSKNRLPNFWVRLHEYCKAGKLDVNRLIKVFFDRAVANQVNLLNFNHENIFSRSVLAAYEKARPTADDCKDNLKSQLLRLESTVPMVALISGLSDSKEIESNAVALINANYSPLFRCCVLAKNGKDFSSWLWAGVNEYRLSIEAYDKVWGDFLPEQIRELGKVRQGVTNEQ